MGPPRVSRERPSDPLRLGGVWYFAFGANMNEQVLVTRRRILPASAERALLLDHRFAFDAPGLPFRERAFANVHRKPGSVVPGVLYRISAADLSRLDRMEGKGIAYLRVASTVRRDDGEELVAWHYRARWPWPGQPPSRRYLDLLLEAAEHWQLPETHRLRLRAARGDSPF